MKFLIAFLFPIFCLANLKQTVFTLAPHDFSVVNVTSSAWVEIYTDIPSAVTELECTNGSIQDLHLGHTSDSTDPSELGDLTVFTEGIKYKINFDSGDDLFLKAITDTANTGNFICNFHKIPIAISN